MDYLKFYKLAGEPFRNDPDPRFYYEGRAQVEARMRLMRGVQQRKGLCALVGGPGCGKTTLARRLLEELDGKERTVRMLSVPHTACDSGWVLPRIASAFGVEQPGSDAMQVLGQIFERLAGLASVGRHAVLLIDEAQMLRNRQVMEEFRGLLNLEHRGAKLLSLVLFGLPELSEVLRLDAPLAQRIDIRVQLGGLDREDTAEYLLHRMKCVGGGGTLLSDEVVDAIFRFTGGIPRLINTLADNTLFEGFLSKARVIDGSIVTAAAEQLGLEPAETRSQEPAASPLANPFGSLPMGGAAASSRPTELRPAPAPSLPAADPFGAMAPTATAPEVRPGRAREAATERGPAWESPIPIDTDEEIDELQFSDTQPTLPPVSPARPERRAVPRTAPTPIVKLQEEPDEELIPEIDEEREPRTMPAVASADAEEGDSDPLAEIVLELEKDDPPPPKPAPAVRAAPPPPKPAATPAPKPAPAAPPKPAAAAPPKPATAPPPTTTPAVVKPDPGDTLDNIDALFDEIQVES